jgi:hypothetical protein
MEIIQAVLMHSVVVAGTAYSLDSLTCLLAKQFPGLTPSELDVRGSGQSPTNVLLQASTLWRDAPQMAGMAVVA